MKPAAIAATPLARPATPTGTLLSVVVPFPSWPPPLLSQHFTPPLAPPAARERTGVGATRGDRADPAGKARDVDGDAGVGRRAVPELAVGVPAPALDPAADRERARVPASRGDRADPAREARDVDRDAAVDCRAVAELA